MRLFHMPARCARALSGRSSLVGFFIAKRTVLPPRFMQSALKGLQLVQEWLKSRVVLMGNVPDHLVQLRTVREILVVSFGGELVTRLLYEAMLVGDPVF